MTKAIGGEEVLVNLDNCMMIEDLNTKRRLTFGVGCYIEVKETMNEILAELLGNDDD
jgi:hypothetical protein